MTMGRFLDLIDGRPKDHWDQPLKTATYDINDINDKSPDFSRLNRLCRTPPSDKGSDFGRLNRLCRTPSSLMAALAALERRCPDYMESEPWQQAVEDGHRFLVRWGNEAERLGWTEADIFGLPPVAPNPHSCWRRLARVDQLGLIWLTHGRPVTAITSERATIETRTGMTPTGAAMIGEVTFYRLRPRQEDQGGKQ
jgi:hypothetical protein